MVNEDRRWKSKSYLHHILPPFSIRVVVLSVIKISIRLLQVNAAGAASLPDLAVDAVVAAHVDQAEDGEGDRNGDEDVVSDGSEVQARFLVGVSRFFFCINISIIGMDQQSIKSL